MADAYDSGSYCLAVRVQVPFLVPSKIFAVVAEWQTRALEVRMGDRVGSSPTDRTIDILLSIFYLFYIYFIAKT